MVECKHCGDEFAKRDGDTNDPFDALCDQCQGMVANEPITVQWLYSVRPNAWLLGSRGISYANWSIHSIRQRPRNIPPGDYDGYDAGPFVWSVAPSHDSNMVPLEKPCTSFYTILVLESRWDVIRLLELLAAQHTDAQSVAQKPE